MKRITTLIAIIALGCGAEGLVDPDDDRCPAEATAVLESDADPVGGDPDTWLVEIQGRRVGEAECTRATCRLPTDNFTQEEAIEFCVARHL